MKREEIVSKLIKEGFSETTLSKFTDSQIIKFANKVIKEVQQITTTKNVYNSKDPKDVAALNSVLKDPKIDKANIEVKEEDIIPVSKIRKAVKNKTKKLNLNKLNEFVDNVVDNTYHSLTTKGEMVELVKTKFINISEKEETDKLPEFMGEVELAEPETAPEVAPDTKPDTKPDKDTPVREKPKHPGIRPTTNPDPAPKAKGDEAKSKIIQLVHRIFTKH